MEGSIARWYEKNTRKSMDDFRSEAERLKAFLPDGGDMLEVAPGPGFLAIEMARDRGIRVTGLDISRTFVELARKNAVEAGVRVDFQLGNASQMPFGDKSFDLLVCRAAFKNFSEPQKALMEMRRVLRPGGQALLIDMRRDASMAEVKEYVDGLGVSRLNRWFMMLSFRGMLIKRAYPIEEIRRMAVEAGWADPRIDTSPLGFAAWTTK